MSGIFYHRSEDKDEDGHAEESKEKEMWVKDTIGDVAAWKKDVLYGRKGSGDGVKGKANPKEGSTAEKDGGEKEEERRR